ncbi:MAG: TA system VapC family ribonuclease toxin [Actinomycetota bacterium]
MYAQREESPLHLQALEFVSELSAGSDPWGLPVFALAEFVRVVTHPRYLKPPTPLPVALSNVDSLLKSPSVRVLAPGPRFWPLLGTAAMDGNAKGNLIYDAQIVAVCLEHGIDTILTEDRDFRRFSAIETRRLKS